MCPRHLLTDETTGGHYTWVDGEYMSTSFIDRRMDFFTEGHYTWVDGEYTTSFADRREDGGALYLGEW